MILVFFISGLVLKTQDLKTALYHKLDVALGFVAILLITPCFGFAIRYLPSTYPHPVRYFSSSWRITFQLATGRCLQV
jgi:predicted Na+-dependent transporter